MWFNLVQCKQSRASRSTGSTSAHTVSVESSVPRLPPLLQWHNPLGEHRQVSTLVDSVYSAALQRRSLTQRQILVLEQRISSALKAASFIAWTSFRILYYFYITLFSATNRNFYIVLLNIFMNLFRWYSGLGMVSLVAAFFYVWAILLCPF